MCQRKFRPIKYTRRYSYAKFDTFFGPPGIYMAQKTAHFHLLDVKLIQLCEISTKFYNFGLRGEHTDY